MDVASRLAAVDTWRQTQQDRRTEAVLVLALCGATLGMVGSALWWLGSFFDQFSCANWGEQENWQPPATCLAARQAADYAGLCFFLCILLLAAFIWALASHSRSRQGGTAGFY